jgi:hypothetical protein
LCAGEAVPAWVRDALPGLPLAMRTSDRRAGHYQRAIIDLTEALILAPHMGETFAASVIAVANGDGRRGMVMLRELAIEGPYSAESGLELGADLAVRLVEADPERRRVAFVPA